MNTQKSKLDYLFYLIPILLIINMIIRWKFTMVISPDTFSYTDLAEHFPYIPSNVFPLGYPIFLKMLNFFLGDYSLAYKIGNLLCLGFSLSFVKIKNFYWREIWTLFTFYALMKITPWAWSETLLIPLLIMVFYYNHQFLHNKIDSKKKLIFYPILIFACFLVKYSALFFIVAHFVFVGFLWLIKDKAKAWTYLKFSTISALLSAIYLLNNYWVTGYAMGKRVAPTAEELNIRFSLSHTFYTINPLVNAQTHFLGIYLNWKITLLLGLLFTLLFGGIILRYFWGKSLIHNTISILKIGGGKMLIFSILHSVIFLFGTIYSYLTTNLDMLDYRLLLGYYLFFFFAVIVALPNFRNKNKTLLLFGLFNASIYIINLVIENLAIL